MTSRRHVRRRRTLAVACSWALFLSQSLAQATVIPATDSRPKINLFPTSVVESLSQTSQAAREMEESMYDVVEKLERQSQAYQRTGCDGSDDAGCLQLRKAIRATYKEMLDYADYFRDEIMTVEGVGKVEFHGDVEERIYLEFSSSLAA